MKTATTKGDTMTAADYLIQTVDPDTERFDFLLDLRRRVVRGKQLSTAQQAAVLRIADKRAALAAEREAEREALKDAPPAPDGKQTITGVIAKTMTKDTAYGWQEKMIVRLPDGNRVYCTIPAALIEGVTAAGPITYGPNYETQQLDGRRVEVTATWTRSDRDDHFAFGSRPRARFID